jgi:transposase
MMTIFERINQRGYTGGYSSVRRFVRTLKPAKSTAVVRVHTAPGEEAQVDFSSAGTLLDPVGSRPRRAWIFVMTLSYSRHQYAELVFDQKISTWLACHRHAFEWFARTPRRVVPDYVPGHIIRLVWPTGLCGRRHPGAGSRSWNPERAADSGHITQPS